MSVAKARTKVLTRAGAVRAVRAAQRRGERVVFTNGCFDLLHVGHVRSLEQARALRRPARRRGEHATPACGATRDPGDRSCRRASAPKCSRRSPASTSCVLFAEATPLATIEALRPDVLAKGGDWALDAIVGRAEVESWGGRVVRLREVPGVRTTEIVEAREKVAARRGWG